MRCPGSGWGSPAPRCRGPVPAAAALSGSSRTRTGARSCHLPVTRLWPPAPAGGPSHDALLAEPRQLLLAQPELVVDAWAGLYQVWTCPIRSVTDNYGGPLTMISVAVG